MRLLLGVCVARRGPKGCKGRCGGSADCGVGEVSQGIDRIGCEARGVGSGQGRRGVSWFVGMVLGLPGTLRRGEEARGGVVQSILGAARAHRG